MPASDFTTHSIYRIVCFVTGEVYIGQTNNVARRKHDHFRKLRVGQHFNQHLQRTYDKYGERAFYFECLESDIPQTLIDEREIYWIKHFDCRKNGFNMTVGGESAGANKTPCSWNGTHYSSIKHAAASIGIRQSTMSIRLAKGYTCDSDMVGIGGNPTNLKRCAWNGINYPSILAASKANNVSIASMKARLDNGYETDDDMPRTTSPKPCLWNGIEYPSVQAAAKANDLRPGYLYKQIRQGKTMLTNWHNKACTWNGISYATISDAAKANNIAASSMSARIAKGYVCDEDMQFPLRHKRKSSIPKVRISP